MVTMYELQGITPNMESPPDAISAAQARNLILQGNAPKNLNVRNPDDAIYGTRLDLRNQANLKVLPDGLTVWGHLDLSGCPGLQALPPDLKAEGLNLEGCTGLQIFPEGIEVGYLYLDCCTALVSIPRKLSLKGILKINHCERLKALPDELSVGGNVWIINCPALETLPSKLTASRILNLANCPHITTFPAATIGELRIGVNTGIREFPVNALFESIYLSQLPKII